MKRSLALFLIAVATLLASAWVSLALCNPQGGCCNSTGGTSVNPDSKFARPIPMGISIGNVQTAHINTLQKRVCGADTAGVLAINSQGVTGIVSTNHGDAANYVPRRFYSGVPLGPYTIGSSITQPGPADLPVAGRPNQFCDATQMAVDGVANLTSSFTVTTLSLDNTIDNAFSQAIAGDTKPNVLNIGLVSTLIYSQLPALGLTLQYMGAGSCWRTFHVLLVHVNEEDFDGQNTYNYTDQYMGDIIATDGDSAAVAFTMGSCPQAVGVVYGNHYITGLVIMNPMPYVVQFNNLNHLVGQTCNGTTEVVQAGVSTPASSDTVDYSVWPNPPDYVANMLASETPEEKAVVKAANELNGVLASDDVGVGSEGTEGHRVIVVSTFTLTPDLKGRTPKSLDGFPVIIRVVPRPTGPIDIFKMR